MKALKGAFADRPIVSVPNVPPVPTGDPVELRAASDEIRERRPDITRAAVATQKLDAFVARMVGEEPTLNDVASVVQLLATTDDLPADRVQSLCFLAARALGKFDAHTRHAPPAALKDLVAESLTSCAAAPDNGCVEDVAPWDGATCGAAECDRAYLRAIGEI